MYLAESLLALRAGRQLQRLFLGLLRASNYLGATDPNVRSQLICSIRMLCFGGSGTRMQAGRDNLKINNRIYILYTYTMLG